MTRRDMLIEAIAQEVINRLAEGERLDEIDFGKAARTAATAAGIGLASMFPGAGKAQTAVPPQKYIQYVSANVLQQMQRDTATMKNMSAGMRESVNAYMRLLEDLKTNKIGFSGKIVNTYTSPEFLSGVPLSAPGTEDLEDRVYTIGKRVELTIEYNTMTGKDTLITLYTRGAGNLLAGPQTKFTTLQRMNEEGPDQGRYSKLIKAILRILGEEIDSKLLNLRSSAPTAALKGQQTVVTDLRKLKDFVGGVEAADYIIALSRQLLPGETRLGVIGDEMFITNITQEDVDEAAENIISEVENAILRTVPGGPRSFEKEVALQNFALDIPKQAQILWQQANGPKRVADLKAAIKMKKESRIARRTYRRW